ncbi:MAG TPA: tetratricopeptide repeat protein [Edaphocola sp.]|nr:tetratricopeptide repeat protein [Edaphocola sp.]
MNNDDSVRFLLNEANQNKQTNAVLALKNIEKALSFKDKIANKTLVDLYQTAGNVFFNQGEYLIALKYFKEQLLIQEQLNPNALNWINNDIGKVYFRLGDTTHAKLYYKKALDGLKESKDTKDKAKIYKVYNNLAVLEELKGNTENALTIYEGCRAICLENDDYTGLIMAYQNIAIANVKLKKYDSAFLNFYNAGSFAKTINSKIDISTIDFNIGDLHYYLNNLDSAVFYFERSLKLAQEQKFSMIELANAEALSKIFQANKNYQKANYYLIIAKGLIENNLKSQDSVKINLVEFSYNQKLAEQQQISKDRKRNVIYLILGIVVLAVAIIIILVIRILRDKLKLKALTIEELNTDIEKKNFELTGKSLELLHNQEIIAETKKELTNLQEFTNPTTKEALSKIKNDLESDTLGIPKEEFEKIFIETHSRFYKNLLQKHPKLTKNELRLCAFLRMNLSTKEISAITKQSQNSIIIAWYRLRKKINMEDSNQNINSYLAQF